MVSDVSSVVADFVSAWVQTNSDYDVLVGKTISSTWATKHQPVLSTRSGHVLYTGYNPIEPEGKLIKCPLACGRGFRTDSSKHSMKVTCLACGYHCLIRKTTKKDPGDKLRKEGLVKVKFPRELLSVDWRVAEKKKAPPTQPSTRDLIDDPEMGAIQEPPPSPPPPTIIEPSHVSSVKKRFASSVKKTSASSSSVANRATLLPPPVSARSISLPVDLAPADEDEPVDVPGPSSRSPIKPIRIPGGLHRSRSAPAPDEDPTPSGSSNKRSARDVTSATRSQKRKRA